MDVIVIVLLVVLSIFLVVVEVLLLPGVTVSAILALCAGVYASYLTYLLTGLPAAMGVFLVALFLAMLTVYICSKKKNISKISLNTVTDSVVLPDVKELVKIGDIGITTTRVAPMGTARFGAESISVKSLSGLIDQKINIVVIGFEDNNVLVEKY